MSALSEMLTHFVVDGSIAGAVALVGDPEGVEVAAVGWADIERSQPMTRDSIFRIASITKPITAAAVMCLIEDGAMGLDDPVDTWLPELADRHVVTRPDGPVDDVVPAARAITVVDLLTFRAGYGFGSDFSWPVLQPLFNELRHGPLSPLAPPPSEWMGAISRLPLVYQPGEKWLYNTCSDLLGVLVARVADMEFGAFLQRRLFEPLGMSDTGFHVDAAKLDRLTAYYRLAEDGSRELVDSAPGLWSMPPPFESGAGGLVSTADDWAKFGQMLLNGGAVDGARILSEESVRQMTTNHLTLAQRQASDLYLEGQGWGYGGSVDIERVDPWSTPGRYGWVGGTGTSAHIVPSTRTVTVLLTQQEMAGPTSPAVMRDFWSLTSAR